MRWLVAASLTLIACRREAPQPLDAGVAVAAPVDAGSELELLERDVNGLLARACTPCHGWSPWALVHTRSACREGGALVVPFEPAQSPLYLKVAGTPRCGVAMPPTGQLPRGAAELIRAWIAAGAPVGGKPSEPVKLPPPEPTTDWAPDPN
ncbi:MAG: hypothetical protein ACOZQL_06185 [Myxococcota bacterium]